MQSVLILRHAKAETWSPVKEDFPRKLTAAGIEHATAVAEWMGENVAPPQSILCSPSQRTRETLAPLLSRQPALDAVTHFLPQIYHATLNTLTTLLDAAFAETDRVLIVGHNPGLEILLGDVTHPRHHKEFDHLPTGTLAVVEFESGWASGRERGTLQYFVRGRDLSAD